MVKKNMREPEEAQEEQQEQEQEMVGAAEEPGSWMDEQVHQAPSWLISFAFHATILLLATAITFAAHEMTKSKAPTIIRAEKEKTVLEQPPERPRGVFDEEGVVKADRAYEVNKEPEIYFPGAKESDHNETASGRDFHDMEGDSLQTRSHILGIEHTVAEGRARGIGNAPGITDSIGAGGGGGGGGRYGRPGRGGRENLYKKRGATSASESAVKASLQWLCRHQSDDGVWSSSGFGAMCQRYGKGDCSANSTGEGWTDAGVTGLALLAFLGYGYSSNSRESYYDYVAQKEFKYGEVIRKGLDWLVEHQDKEGTKDAKGNDVSGCIGRVGTKYMYSHSAAALALAEGYGMSEDAKYKVPAQMAVDFIARAQNQTGEYDRKGWRYTFRSGDNDTSVMGWCIMALKSAAISGLGTSKAALGGAKGWVEEVTDSSKEYAVGYNSKETAGRKVAVRGQNTDFAHHDALAAIAMLSRMFIDHNRDNEAVRGYAKLLLQERNIPNWDNSGAEKQIDFYHWYYATLAMYFYTDGDQAKDNEKKAMWEKWKKAMLEAVIGPEGPGAQNDKNGPHQHRRKSRCKDGSWDPDIDRWGFEGGRVYTTAINALTLEVFYRYQSNIFK